MVEKIAYWGQQTLDELARLVWATPVSGEIVVNPTDSTGAGATAATNAPRLETFLRAAAALQDRGVPKIGSTYIALISAQTAFALTTQTGQLALQENRLYADTGELKTGRIGILDGIDFHIVGRKIAPTGTTVRDIVAGADSFVYSELSQITSGHAAGPVRCRPPRSGRLRGLQVHVGR